MSRLVIFDVDGTLVDSQGAIVAAMTAAFQQAGLDVPERHRVMSIVGLSLDHAMFRLAPDVSADRRVELVEGYKSAYHQQRQTEGATAGSPLYPNALDVLQKLSRRTDVTMAVATGKSRRGLDALLDAHELTHMFATTQVSDDHPSKPHPSMIEAVLAATGCNRQQTVMVGDTSFDLQMANAANVASIGVSWGYHPVDELRAHSAHIIDGFEALPEKLDQIWGRT